MSVQSDIEAKLTNSLQPNYLEVINESNNHNVPPGSESHFKVVIVTDAFDGKMLVARHRMINEILADELQHKIHALALHTYTPAEWEEVSGNAPASPPCLGGGKN
ncbi:MAG: BolA/IbaG family iron-sulfur metabolism protein [Gammaproteobacteria bacterium]|nr:BolA/IbaG family iron-sulfur metabolism protein [Gammaproteobacteria bacterium]